MHWGATRKLAPTFVIAIAVVIAIAGCGGSAPVHRPASKSKHRTVAAAKPQEPDVINVDVTRNIQLSRSAAALELAELHLPPRSVAERHDPTRNHILSSPGALLGSVDTGGIDLRRYWLVPGSPSSLMTWLAAHPPAGAQGSGGEGFGAGGGIGYSFQTTSTIYSFTPLPGVHARQLLITVTRAPRGHTALRADAQAVWQIARGRDSLIPRTVISVRLNNADSGLFADKAGHELVTRPTAVAQLVALFNALPAQRRSPDCPTGGGQQLTLTFRGPGRSVLATASIGAVCAKLTVGHDTTYLTTPATGGTIGSGNTYGQLVSEMVNMG